MKQEKLTYLLQNPSAVGAEETLALREIVDQYPYFQAARALRLKGLKSTGSLHYNKELKLTASYTADRGVLFDYITSTEFNQNKIADQIKQQERQELSEHESLAEEKEEKSVQSLDQALQMKLRESERVFDPDLFSRTKEDPESTPEDELRLGTPLSFEKEENHSFSEWLKLSTAKPVQRKEEPGEPPEHQSRKQELINDFIAKNPRITPSKASKKINLAEEHLTAPEALMTETLARVYLEQKNYKKAIQAFRILILKNPEKSGFFADQIRAIEKLQENNS